MPRTYSPETNDEKCARIRRAQQQQADATAAEYAVRAAEKTLAAAKKACEMHQLYMVTNGKQNSVRMGGMVVKLHGSVCVCAVVQCSV